MTLVGSRIPAHQVWARLASGHDVWLGARPGSDWDVLDVPRGARPFPYDCRGPRQAPPGAPQCSLYRGLAFPVLAGDVEHLPPTLDYLLYPLNARVPSAWSGQNLGLPVRIFSAAGRSLGEITYWPLPGIHSSFVLLHKNHPGKPAFLAFLRSLTRPPAP